jgi:putative ABC transport system substrate-binding protein
MFRRRYLAAVLVVAAVLACCSTGSDEPSSDDSYSVGVLVMGQAQIVDDVVNAFTETAQVGVGDGARVIFAVKNANGDQSLVASIARGLASSNRDAFAGIGTPADIAPAAQVTDRPIFAPAMDGPVGAGVAQSLRRPGRTSPTVVAAGIDAVGAAMTGARPPLFVVGGDTKIAGISCCSTSTCGTRSEDRSRGCFNSPPTS